MRYIDILKTGEASTGASHYGPRSLEDVLPSELAQGQGQKVLTLPISSRTALPIVLNAEDGAALVIPNNSYIERVVLRTTQTATDATLAVNIGHAPVDGAAATADAFVAAAVVGALGDIDLDSGSLVGKVLATANGTDSQITVSVSAGTQGVDGAFTVEITYRDSPIRV